MCTLRIGVGPSLTLGNIMNINRIDLVSLAIFSKVAKTGSISKGAEASNIAIGAASRRLVELESTLGVTLMERHSRGIELTPAGFALKKHAEYVLNSVRNLSSELNDYSKGVIGTVKLASNTAAFGQGLSDDLAYFEKNNAIKVEIQEMDSARIALELIEGNFDMGIIAEGTQQAGLQTTLYKRDRLVSLIPHNCPLKDNKSIKIAETLDYEFISLPRKASLTKRLFNHYSELNSSMRIRFYVKSYEAMWNMVKSGLGIAIIPAAAAKNFRDTPEISTLDLDESWAERSLLLACKSVEDLNRASRELYDHLRNKDS